MALVSIPQAVGTIAIDRLDFWLPKIKGFNTASGRYYCNEEEVFVRPEGQNSFNTASGRYYCNM